MTGAIVIKYGGSLLDDPAHRADFLREVATLSCPQSVILVHGGGKEITRQMEKAGLEPRFVNGRRFTDERTMQVVEQALSGLNAGIVEELCAYGAEAKGFSGRSQHVLQASAVSELGRVGIPEKVDAAALQLLIKGTALPVFYSVAEDAAHQPLNINADDFALAVAVALKAARLIFLTDTGGILDGQKKLISQLTPVEVESLITQNVINGGMMVKARACVQALKDGVGAVDIVKGIGHLRKAGAPEGTVFVNGH